MSHDIALLVATSIQESLKVKQALLDDKDILSLIATVAKEFVSALSQGHKILLFGNGGSAADAQQLPRNSWADSRWSEPLSPLSR